MLRKRRTNLSPGLGVTRTSIARSLLTYKECKRERPSGETLKIVNVSKANRTPLTHPELHLGFTHFRVAHTRSSYLLTHTTLHSYQNSLDNDTAGIIGDRSPTTIRPDQRRYWQQRQQ